MIMLNKITNMSRAQPFSHAFNIAESIFWGAKPDQEAPPGFEPGMADLQSTALPLG
jgi:hypothetical protein